MLDLNKVLAGTTLSEEEKCKLMHTYEGLRKIVIDARDRKLLCIDTGAYPREVTPSEQAGEANEKCKAYLAFIDIAVTLIALKYKSTEQMERERERVREREDD